MMNKKIWLMNQQVLVASTCSTIAKTLLINLDRARTNPASVPTCTDGVVNQRHAGTHMLLRFWSGGSRATPTLGLPALVHSEDFKVDFGS